MGFFDFFKKKEPLPAEQWPPVSQKWIDDRKRIADAMITEARSSGYFKADKIPELSEKIKASVMDRNYYKDPFNNNDCLTAEEKKKYGFNTRLKISKELIGFLSDEGLRLENPKAILENTYNKQFNIINNEYREKSSQIINSNSSLFSGYRLVGTLDTRTCLVCGSLDGKIFDTEEAATAHKCLNEHCRCVVLPVIKGMEDFDEDDERASMDGPVSASTTYEKWLKKQPVKIKKEILGDYYEKYKNGTSLEELVKIIKTP